LLAHSALAAIASADPQSVTVIARPAAGSVRKYARSNTSNCVSGSVVRRKPSSSRSVSP